MIRQAVPEMRRMTRLYRISLRALILFMLLSLSAVMVLTAATGKHSATAQFDTEYFYSVTHSTYDSDYDGYDDSVTLTIDVDTTGSYSYVTVYGVLADPYGYEVHLDFTSWGVYGSASEYGNLYLTATLGDPGQYSYQLEIYDDLAYWEDSWSGSVYLYPLGYGGATVTTPTPSPVPTPTPTPTPSPDGGGLSGGIVAGIVVGALIVTVPGFFWANKSTKRRRATNAQIRELKTQMELWREEGYDVSELEDLFK